MSKFKIKVVIGEDEPIILSYLKKILGKHNDLEVVGEVTDGKALLQVARKETPHVIFVDIDMPEIDGLSAVKLLLKESDFKDLQVVFITGHSDFAIEAFNIASTDYILKPFEEERIDMAVERIKTNCKLQRLKSRSPKTSNPNRLTIKSGHEIRFINMREILFIERSGKKTKIYTKEGTFETTEALSALEDRLDPENFVRSHKSFIINLDLIEKLTPWGHRCYEVSFAGINKKALITRSKLELYFDSIP